MTGGVKAVCPYCWGSHGCDLTEGHDGDHECHVGHGDKPLTIPRGDPSVFNAFNDEPEVVA